MTAKLELNFHQALEPHELSELAKVGVEENKSLERIALEAIKDWARRRREARAAEQGQAAAGALAAAAI